MVMQRQLSVQQPVNAADATPMDWVAARQIKRFTSTQQVISQAGLITVAHSLTDENGAAVRPIGTDFYIVCVTASNGFTVGQTFKASFNSTTTGATRSNVLLADTTNLIFRFSDNANPITSTNPTNGNAESLVVANFRLVLTAWY